MITVFISYASEDTELAESFQDYLNHTEPLKFKAILVEYEKNPSEFFNDKVTHYLENCDAFIPLITKNSLTNEWVNQEIGYAYSLKKRFGIKIIAIVHDRKEMKKGFLNKFVDLPFEWDKNDVKKTFKEVKEHMLEEIPYPIEIHEPLITIRVKNRGETLRTSQLNEKIHQIETHLKLEHVGKREIEYIQFGIVYPSNLSTGHNLRWENSINSDKIPKSLENYFEGESNLMLLQIYNMKPRTFQDISIYFYRPQEDYPNGTNIRFGIYIAPEGFDPEVYEIEYRIIEKDEGKTTELLSFKRTDKVEIKSYIP